jgi:hypothetical protein
VPPHEVIDDELAALFEQIEQGRGPARPGKGVLLLDLDHWQRTAAGVNRVFHAGELLLLGKQLLARCEPFIP